MRFIFPAAYTTVHPMNRQIAFDLCTEFKGDTTWMIRYFQTMLYNKSGYWLAAGAATGTQDPRTSHP